ncbi:hypothetical protein DFH08DRAFT_1082936 [Mycena albidolilacea]|uniref:Membrane anchor Opy2 N-terminal domain-containing protein n=1 Tax=Mycena albidolilacea TaxID=1033008 RepID=A0AAD6ZSE8_9AGAR|nr:hypothetical protein DFH08DRAFT_1082936 [Mycena albidolilacea]
MMFKLFSFPSLLLASLAIGAVLSTPLDAVTRDDKCVACPKIFPVCDCAEGQECVIIGETCKECAHAICVPPAPAEEAGCIICTQQVPECNCDEDQECVIVGQTCTACAHATCVVPPTL